MKKFVTLFLLILSLGLLAACGEESASNEIKVGATRSEEAHV